MIETGIIVNTHGAHGEVKIQPWADSPEVLTGLEYLYIDGAPVRLLSAKVHKGCVLAALEGITDIDGAMKLKNRTVSMCRDDVPLEEGRHFIADLVGLRAVDSETGDELGTVSDVLLFPANNVYVISGEREMLVPAVPDFIDGVDIAGGCVRIRLVDGL